MPDAPMPAPAVHVADLRKTFSVPVREAGLTAAAKSLVRRESREIKAVDGVGFDIEHGEVVGFLGPNGAGKTTTLKMLSGLLYPTSGEALVLATCRRAGSGRSCARSRWSWATATSSSGTCRRSTRSS